MVHSTLSPMMYDPNFFTLNLEQILSGVPLDTAIGVLQIIVRSARGIKGSKIGGGTPDPYVSLTFNDRAGLAKTKHKLNTSVAVTCVAFCFKLTHFQLQSYMVGNQILARPFAS
jgi:Ca2+-dependent lipid-binding protein